MEAPNILSEEAAKEYALARLHPWKKLGSPSDFYCGRRFDNLEIGGRYFEDTERGSPVRRMGDWPVDQPTGRFLLLGCTLSDEVPWDVTLDRHELWPVLDQDNWLVAIDAHS